VIITHVPQEIEIEDVLDTIRNALKDSSWNPLTYFYAKDRGFIVVDLQTTEDKQALLGTKYLKFEGIRRKLQHPVILEIFHTEARMNALPTLVLKPVDRHIGRKEVEAIFKNFGRDDLVPLRVVFLKYPDGKRAKLALVTMKTLRAAEVCMKVLNGLKPGYKLGRKELNITLTT
jgi:hypothetical protein